MTVAGVKQVLNKATLGEAGGITMQDKCPKHFVEGFIFLMPFLHQMPAKQPSAPQAHMTVLSCYRRHLAVYPSGLEPL